MIKKYRAAWAVGLTAASALAVSALAAGPAMAGGNIDSSTASTGVSQCENETSDYYCLWYSQNYAGGVWGAQVSKEDPISGNFTGSGAGVGHAAINSAASMANPTVECNLTTWYATNFSGPYDWLDPLNAGNLTSDLRNNEHMIQLNTGPGCTNLGG